MKKIKMVVLSVILTVLYTGCSSEVPGEVQDVGADWLDHLYLSFTGEEEYSTRPGLKFEGFLIEYAREEHEFDEDENVYDHFWEIYIFRPNLKSSSMEIFYWDNPDYVFEFIEDFNHMSELLELENEYYIED